MAPWKAVRMSAKAFGEAAAGRILRSVGQEGESDG